MGTYTRHENITGQRRGRWLILRKGPEKYKTEFCYWCRCDCGTEKYVRPASLHNGDSKSCGCLRTEMIDGSKYVGNRYGKITVLAKTERQDGLGAWLYKCQCDCGKIVLFTAKRFAAQRRGAFQSCGCLRGVKLLKGESGFNLVWHEYTSSCKKTGRVFTLTKEEFRHLLQQNCFYCGVEPRQVKQPHRAATTYGQYIYNGIDRVDNNKGYSIDNTVTCCFQCNAAKGTLTQEAFIAMAHQISKHQQIAIEP